jgi:myo-inositol-1(or 4)-monophosphatase
VSDQQRAEYLQLGLEIAEEAGRTTLPYFRSELSIVNKREDGRFDPVTQADHAAEKLIRQRLGENVPAHGIFGEEFGHVPGNGLTWVIDPIDGTRAFMTGMLHWGLLLALFDGRRPLLGIMHQPFTGEFFYGDGRSAFYRRGGDHRELRVSPSQRLDDAVLTTTSPGLIAEGPERAAFDRLEKAVKLSKYGGDCYIYAMVAMGFVDLAVDGGLQPYDIQALIPIIEGAGGVVTTAQGRDASMGGFIVAASGPDLHAQALARMWG